MNYQETLQFLYAQLPMYSRIGKAAYKKDLTNTRLLCTLLGNPENKFRSIHVAGTNGKGSTSHALAAVLQQSGYKTGLFTSPHLKDFRERIRINGKMIPEDRVITFVENYKDEVLRIGCSFFEWTAGLAFDYFAEEHVDIAVIETGLGGRLDSTNVITPVLSVITNISYDHMDMLGDTIEKIAIEKAGIIKSNVPVVIGEKMDDSASVFTEIAIERDAPISFAQESFTVSHVEFNLNQTLLHINGPDGKKWAIACDLTGYYQEKNIVTVLQSLEILKQSGFQITEENALSALSQIKKLTGLRGRWDILSDRPLVIADVAHNEAGLALAIRQLKTYPFSRLHFVIGFVREKDLSAILHLFPQHAHYYFCRPDIPRGLDAGFLQQVALENGLNGEKYASVKDAFDAARSNATGDDLIYVGGSTFVVAEIL